MDNVAISTTRETALELGMRDRGVRRMASLVERAKRESDLSSTPGGVEALRHLVEPVAASITSYLATEGQRMGRPQIAARLIEGLDPFLVAYISVKEAINLSDGTVPLMRTARAIATAIEAEVRLAEFEGSVPALYTSLRRALSQKSWDAGRQLNAYNGAASSANLKLTSWTLDEKVHLGTKLIDLIVDSVGVIEVRNVPERFNKTVNKIVLTDAGRTWIDTANAKAGLLRPDWAPTVVPPVPWTNLKTGGYVTDALRPLRLVKRTTRPHVEALEAEGTDLSKVYRALNAIQETPWRVNRSVFEVMDTACDRRVPLPCLPDHDDAPLPSKPEDIGSNDAARVAYREAAKAVFDRRAEARGARLNLGRVRLLAQEYLSEEAIYFPHQLDFRGRAYAVPVGLDPQGTDFSKGVLEFAEGKPVGDTGAAWLAIHGANVFGEDKVSFDDRIAWAEQHTEDILRAASDPFGYQWWTEADKPWSFLAWCHEWAGYQEEGTAFRNRIPIALDGSCNGLQHFSAMLRDPIGGAAVNLVPSDKPQDIYQRVADRTVERLRAASQQGGPDAWIARGWVDFGIDRKITKRPVMVLPYGGTMASCLEYVRAAVNARILGGHSNPFGMDLSKATGPLASNIWSSIGDVVVAARQVMAWLQQVARVAARYNVPLQWTTPSGFIAHQAYRRTKHRRIKTRLRGELTYVSHHIPTDVIDADRQSLAISPNFVHSLDAAAMMLTINLCIDAGISTFAMIHDSYGTHAADTDRMARCLRRAFVEMYQPGDILDRFRAEVCSQLPEDARNLVPQPPPMGTLDLSLIYQSAYFFA